MCEKVKLDKRTADAIEHFRGEGKTNKDILGISTSFNADGSLNDHIHVLALTDFDDLARALYIGYEVEPEFKVRDFVKNDRGRVVEILEDKGNSFVVGWIANGKLYKETVSKNSILRHVTKQEIWWAEHERGDWELRRGDVIVDKRHSRYFIVTGFALDRYYMQPINYIDEESHPYQTRLIDDVKDNFKVAFFVEDRKDA